MSIVNFLLKITNRQKKILLLCASFWAFTSYFTGWDWVSYNGGFNEFRVTRYIIYNNKCKIPDFNSWHYEARKRRKHLELNPSKIPALVYMQRNLQKVFLLLNRSTTHWIIEKCTACLVGRDTNFIKPDNKIRLHDCKDFKDTLEMLGPAVDVKCYRKNDPNLLYHQVFANYIWPDKPKCSMPNSKVYSVIIVGIDSVSKFSFKRQLPKTYEHLVGNAWTEFVAFNKIGQNTLPILFGLLTGRELPSNNTFFDKHHFIWDDYRNSGYVTSFIEDYVSINTFNWQRDGFKKEPTDFYFRPYSMAFSALSIEDKNLDHFRFGGQISANRILDLARELPFACEKQPYFGFFWMNSFSHTYYNALQLLDSNLTTFFEDLKNDTNFDNSVIIFMADHGFRLGGIRTTVQGWYEDLLPFLFIHLPENFKKQHPDEYENFLLNSRRLTSAYDIYLTLQDVLLISNRNLNSKMTFNGSEACPTCNSIFRRTPEERSCAEAGIPDDFCSCITWNVVNVHSKLAQLVAECVVVYTQNLIDSFGEEAYKCQKLRMYKVLHARISSESGYDNITKVIVALKTKPFTSLEAQMNVNISDIGVNCGVIGKPQRIDVYNKTGYCVDDNELKKYCYCKEIRH